MPFAPPRLARLGVLVLMAALLPSSAAAADVKVEVDGVKDALRDNVLAALRIASADDPSPDRVRQLHEGAAEDIALALEPFGYYRPRVTSELREEEGRFVAHYRIDPGEVMRIAGVDLQVTGPGAGSRGFREVAADFPLRRGSPLLHAGYEAGKDALVDHAASHGYLDAEMIVSEIRVDLAAYSARIRLHYYTGPQYRFGEVTFDEAMLDPKLLAGYVPFERGEPFDLNELLELQEALASSPYFRRVEVVPQERLAEGLEVPVHVSLIPARRERWAFGLGYGPDTGVRSTVGVDIRRVNRRGHRAQVRTNVSEVESRFEGTFIVPKRAARTDFTSYSIGYSEIDSDTTQQETGVVSAALDRARGSWREHFALSWQQEDFVVGPDSGTAELLMPIASWGRKEADDVLYTLEGHELRFGARIASEDALSTATFLQGTAQAKYVRLLWGPIRGIGRVQAGYTETDTFRELPGSIRFYAGGDQSVRGYGYQELTPRDDDGEPIGGRALFTASFELDAMFFEFRDFGRFGVAAFYDTGNAMMDFELGDLRSGVGAGIRWLSPVGLVRADAAMALDLPGTPVRFHFTLGPDL
jgi:translocation and assembly module TamA